MIVGNSNFRALEQGNAKRVVRGGKLTPEVRVLWAHQRQWRLNLELAEPGSGNVFGSHPEATGNKCHPCHGGKGTGLVVINVKYKVGFMSQHDLAVVDHVDFEPGGFISFDNVSRIYSGLSGEPVGLAISSDGRYARICRYYAYMLRICWRWRRAGGQQ